MNFEIKRLSDVKLILRVFTVWIFIQVLRDIVTYSAMMHLNPATIIWQAAEGTGYRQTLGNIFALCAACIVPHFVHTLLGRQNENSKRYGRLAVYSLFFLFLAWLTLIPAVMRVPAASWYVALIYIGNGIEVLALATVFAWNINQYMKYELDYGHLIKTPVQFQTT